MCIFFGEVLVYCIELLEDLKKRLKSSRIIYFGKAPFDLNSFKNNEALYLLIDFIGNLLFVTPSA